MRLVSPFLKRVVYPGLSKAGYFLHDFVHGPVVLTYHGILPDGYRIVDSHLDGSLVTAECFRRQLQFLTRHYTVIRPEEFRLWCEAKQSLPPRSVLLTCDDGLQSCLTGMLPILEEFGLSCLFFLTGASLRQQSAMLWYEELFLLFLAAGDRFTLRVLSKDSAVSGRQQKRLLWWNLVRELSRLDVNSRTAMIEDIRKQLCLDQSWRSEYLGECEGNDRFLLMNAGQVRQLAAVGMDIGAHTMSHSLLPQCSMDLAWSEILECKQVLEQELCRRVWAMAYPFGDANAVTSREIMMARKAGFSCAFLNLEGTAIPAAEFALPRVHVTRDMSEAEFAAHVSGFHQLLKQGLIGVNEPSVVASG